MLKRLIKRVFGAPEEQPRQLVAIRRELRALRKEQKLMRERADEQLQQAKLVRKRTEELFRTQTRQGQRARTEAIVAQVVASERLRLEYRAQKIRGSDELCLFGEKYFSQNGEDGIIQEIARRLDTKIETFVEFGGGDGEENNTLYLLFCGARGLWVECGEENVANIRRLHDGFLASGALRLVDTPVNAENADAMIRAADLAGEVDLLSVDIDGNDYWVWKAIRSITPKIVVIEYNWRFGPHVEWVKAYDPEYMWEGRNSYQGASLKSLEKLGREKGYALVGCNFSGVNAFFVRKDLLGDRFGHDFTAEAHYHPFRRVFQRELKTFRYSPYERV